MMKRLTIHIILLVSGLLFSYTGRCQTGNILKTAGVSFEMNGKPFEFTGVSFFNAIYNPEFNRNSDVRKGYIRKFKDYGINVLRIWCQWDNARGFIDGGKGKTMYDPDGSLREEWIERLKGIINDADSENTVILLVLFSRESWNENIRLSDEASIRAVAEMTSLLKPHRNLIFQVWNEFNYRTIEYMKVIKVEDPDRIVTNSPGYGGYLGTEEENRALDYLSPHTSRDDNRHWELSPDEIRYLLQKYNKPVVDDEPARRGTSQFGGPKSSVYPEDHIIHIYNIWKSGGYVIYHHDMFQTGYGSKAVPPNGIPVPGFSEYHDAIFEFLKNKERYLKALRR